MSDARMGLWGGEHVRLDVADDGAQVEFDCAHATVEQKIVLDAEGRFDVRGTHVRERGGPVRMGERPDSHPARFTGRIDGDAMTLTVTETDTGETTGPFELRYGARPHVVKCR